MTPKIESLADAMYEVEADLAIVTETWLQDRNAVDDLIDMAGEHGLDMYARNRQDKAAVRRRGNFCSLGLVQFQATGYQK